MYRAPVCAAECCGSSETVLRLSLVTRNVLFIGLALPGFGLLCSAPLYRLSRAWGLALAPGLGGSRLV